MIKNNSDKNRPSSSGIQYRQYSPGASLKNKPKQQPIFTNLNK
jgi:hypothetical protein